MESDKLTVEEFIKTSSRQYLEDLSLRVKKSDTHFPVVTICMEPGSGGWLIAQQVAKRMSFDLYHREILLPMAHTGNVSPEALNAMEKMRLSGFNDLVSSLINKDYLHTDQYMELLQDTVRALGVIGHAVIVGRGANFILSPKRRFAIRVIAPLDVRIKNVAFAHGLSLKEAEKRIKNRASRRKAFIKQNFHQDINDPRHYDLVLNTARMDVDCGAEAIVGTLIGSQVNRPLEKDESYILRHSK